MAALGDAGEEAAVAIGTSALTLKTCEAVRKRRGWSPQLCLTLQNKEGDERLRWTLDIPHICIPRHRGERREMTRPEFCHLLFLASPIFITRFTLPNSSFSMPGRISRVILLHSAHAHDGDTGVQVQDSPALTAWTLLISSKATSGFCLLSNPRRIGVMLHTLQIYTNGHCCSGHQQPLTPADSRPAQLHRAAARPWPFHRHRDSALRSCRCTTADSACLHHCVHF